MRASSPEHSFTVYSITSASQQRRENRYFGVVAKTLVNTAILRILILIVFKLLLFLDNPRMFTTVFQLAWEVQTKIFLRSGETKITWCIDRRRLLHLICLMIYFSRESAVLAQILPGSMALPSR